MQQDVLLVGSIPLDTPEQVFREFGGPLGSALKTMPDGEVGPRKHWISRIHYQVLSGHAELETVRRPAPENGVERLFPRNAADSWLFKVKDGVERVRFGDVGWRIGYARDAINSYFMFKTLREQGKLAKLASVNSALPPRIFPDVKDVDKVRPGFTDALAAEVDSIVKHIPNDDLAIQWDCSTEVQDAYGAVPGYSAESAIERNIAQFRILSPRIPESVELGYHFCFGHARRLAAFRARGSFGDRTPGQRHHRGVRPPRRLGSHSRPARRQGILFRAAEGFAAARRARLSRRHPSHGRLQGAHCAGAEVSAGIRARGLLRLRPHPASRDAGRAQRASPGDQGRALII